MDQTAYPFVSRICLTVVIGVPLSLTAHTVGRVPGTSTPCITTHDGGLALCQCCTAVLPHHEPSGAHWCLSTSSPGKNGGNRRLVSAVRVRLHRMPIRCVPVYQVYRPSLALMIDRSSA